MAEVSINSDPHANAPTLEQQAAALDAAAAERAVKEQQGERPDWLPEQFKSVEDYNKSFMDSRAEVTRLQQRLAELEKGKEPPAEGPKENIPQEGEKPVTAPEKTAEEIAAEAEADPNKAAEDIAKAAGVDLTSYSTEFEETGDVSEENRVKIAEALKGQLGEAAKSLVDQFVENAKVAKEVTRKSVLAEVGGEEGYSQLVEWAKANQTKEQIEAFNRQVTNTDAATQMLALRGLKASMEAAVGKQPTLLTGQDGAQSEALAPFKSANEMKNAMNDPRYAKDPDYRAAVIQRTMISNI